MPGRADAAPERERPAAPESPPPLVDLVASFEIMRRHHARICTGTVAGTYPSSEADKVGALMDELAKQIGARVKAWRDSTDPLMEGP
jgi:hypothetical protein